MTKREREKLVKGWADRYGCKPADVKLLRRYIDMRGEAATHECNGDWHPVRVPAEQREDKNINCVAWGRDVEKLDSTIQTLALGMGFTGIDTASGLFPTVHKGDDRHIIVP